MLRTVCFLVILSCIGSCSDSTTVTTPTTEADTTTARDTTVSTYSEVHRPQLHFSPKAHWMNDPNGMVYFNDQYHLFFQYYPDSTVWGPMHWGHAISKDLVHWEETAVALYPDSLGYIFSGSTVVDVNNSTGFGKGGKPPLVAIFTHHDPAGEKAGSSTYQNQSLAYSTDEGRSWTKYSANPVLRSPNIKDFRDPKVMWYEKDKKWIMTLATTDRISFYSSPDLKSWSKQSEFGKTVGAHGGVWECPDLFTLEHEGKKIWVLLVSINPGGPNKGSATQYFTGSFDGKVFTPFQTDTRWIDWGTDNYAGVTFFNTGERKIFMGWMSNWLYGTSVPTEKWRSAMTVPRDLALQKIDGKYMLTSNPAPELNALVLSESNTTLTGIDGANFNLTKKTGGLDGPARLELTAAKAQSFTVTLSNSKKEALIVGYDQKQNQYYIDRSKAGKVDFVPVFAEVQTAPRIGRNDSLNITFVIDDASIEVFADGGLTTMTAIFFPNEKFSDIQIASPDKLQIGRLQFNRYKSIWKQ